MASQSRPRRQTTHRRHYGEDSDSGEASRPSLRSPRTRPNYAVDASSSSDSESANAILEPATTQAIPLRTIATRSTAPRRPKRAAHPTRSKPFTSFKRRKVLGGPSKQKNAIDSENTPVLWVRPGGKIPPWQDLEHSIIAEILKQAAYPLYTDYVRPTASIRWLIGISRLSKSFHEAAMSALLFCPPLIPYGIALTELLRKDQQSLSTNYQVKPRRLVVEAKYLLVKKGGILNLAELVVHTPLLESLRLVSHYDELSAIWAHPSAAKKTYSYQHDLFGALQNSCPRLQEFEWNGRFGANLSEVIDSMHAAASYPVFKGLTSITLMNLILPDKATEELRASLELRLLEVLSALPRLSHLRITRCNVFGDFANLATLDSSRLKSLTITECPSLTSAGLQSFLEAKGSKLEELRLTGCQACSGGFLSMLSDYCPSLAVLQLDMTYQDVTSYNDTDAHFDDFLPDGSISFPSALVEIDIQNIRKITSAQLEGCLEALVNTEVKHLRHLRIKAILTISDYRIRARIRNEWREKLELVFLRHSPPPLSSIPRKGLGRHFAGQSDLSATSTSDEATKRQSGRLSRSSRPEAQDNASGNVNQGGMCQTVEFRVDDERPAASQYREGDFLDDEASGDGDYDGRNVNEETLWGY